ncbi:hypothetical protein LWI29_009974 [Acer saccharum]|uniref:DUF4216 domain-containing protein n=1 Tax=Acer saccharum TaxID=4024 RepID=A0AA39VBI0_ACESA|nr:hypothetical protein LWI29_009974 [Acer saccharum]
MELLLKGKIKLKKCLTEGLETLLNFVIHKGIKLICLIVIGLIQVEKEQRSLWDSYRLTVNIKRKLNTQDTFVLACQANQVYYTEGLLDNNWHVVNEIKPRNLYEMPIDGEPYQEETQFNITNVNQEGNENEEDEINWSRVEADVMIVE